MAEPLAGMEVLEEARAPRAPTRIWLQGGADPDAVGAAVSRAFGAQGVVFGYGDLARGADVLLLALAADSDVASEVGAAAAAGHRVVAIGRGEEQHAPAMRAGARGFVVGPSPSPSRLASAILAALPSRSAAQVPQDRFRRIAEEATDMVSVHAPDGAYTYVSPSCRKLLGREPEDLLGRSAYDFFHPDDLQRIQASHQSISRTPDVYVVRYRIRRLDGTYTWFETTSKTIRDPAGDVKEILAHSRDISRRIEEQRRLQQEVVDRAAAERERAIDAYRRSLLNAAGHGLRTPLTPMRLQLASLQKAGLAPRHARSVDLVARNVERLGQAIEGFLELARIHTDAVPFDLGDVDLADAVRQAVLRLDEQAARRDVEILAKADTPVPVNADLAHIDRVLTELIENALTACDPFGHVRVEAAFAGEEARVTVADDGRGFPPDDAESLFEPFQTGERPGRGLGLAIARALLGRQGGHITAHSDGPGQGAVFTFAMPLATSQAAAGVAEPEGPDSDATGLAGVAAGHVPDVAMPHAAMPDLSAPDPAVPGPAVPDPA